MQERATLYERLGVRPDASSEEIDEAYRAGARLYHPDANDSPDAEATMQLINEAAAVLRDPERRREYDRSLHPDAGGPAAAKRNRSEPSPFDQGIWSGARYNREKRRQQAAAQGLGTVWGPQPRPYEETPRLGCVGMLGIMLFLPIFVALIVLLGRYLH
jgi:curved DNA-binding protein CbpA